MSFHLYCDIWLLGRPIFKKKKCELLMTDKFIPTGNSFLFTYISVWTKVADLTEWQSALQTSNCFNSTVSSIENGYCSMEEHVQRGWITAVRRNAGWFRWWDWSKATHDCSIIQQNWRHSIARAEGSRCK